jgi:integral membrane protein
MAFTTAVLLVLLVFVGVPLQIWGNDRTLAELIGIAHGYLFMVYLVTAFDVGIRLRWQWLKFALILLAGTVPFAAFFAEHYVRLDVQAKLANRTEEVLVQP